MNSKTCWTDEETIYTYAYELLSFRAVYEKMSKASNPYGDGHASERIVDAIVERYKYKDKNSTLEREK